jgi:hypothetical protein
LTAGGSFMRFSQKWIAKNFWEVIVDDQAALTKSHAPAKHSETEDVLPETFTPISTLISDYKIEQRTITVLRRGFKTA